MRYKYRARRQINKLSDYFLATGPKIYAMNEEIGGGGGPYKGPWVQS